MLEFSDAFIGDLRNSSHHSLLELVSFGSAPAMHVQLPSEAEANSLAIDFLASPVVFYGQLVLLLTLGMAFVEFFCARRLGFALVEAGDFPSDAVAGVGAGLAETVGVLL